jgi:uncharacterized membrane protein YoaK (UPF0700 family)
MTKIVPLFLLGIAATSWLLVHLRSRRCDPLSFHLSLLTFALAASWSSWLVLESVYGGGHAAMATVVGGVGVAALGLPHALVSLRARSTSSKPQADVCVGTSARADTVAQLVRCSTPLSSFVCGAVVGAKLTYAFREWCLCLPIFAVGLVVLVHRFDRIDALALGITKEPAAPEGRTVPGTVEG